MLILVAQRLQFSCTEDLCTNNTAGGSMAEKTSLSRREQYRNPFEIFANEMERFFNDVGFGRSWPSQPPASGSRRQAALEMWAPQIEVSHQNNELLVRADLPGLKKEDVSVDLTD